MPTITNRQRRDFEKMIVEDLQPVEAITAAIEERTRLKVERELVDHLGLDALLKRKRQLDREQRELDAQLERVIGESWRSRNLFYAKDSPFGLEVAARMANVNGVVGKFRNMKKELLRKVRLINAPDKMLEILESIPDKVKALHEEGTKKLKALPEPSMESSLTDCLGYEE